MVGALGTIWMLLGIEYYWILIVDTIDYYLVPMAGIVGCFGVPVVGTVGYRYICGWVLGCKQKQSWILLFGFSLKECNI